MVEVNKIYCGDCREIMKEWDSECIDMVITSPPYLGLRDYKLKPLIWDGDEDCEHEWNIERTARPNTSGGLGYKQDTNRGSRISNYHDRATYSNFCSLCGAWKGQLGLEPTFDLYIQHLCDIFDGVKRVLKKEGSIWVNLGDTYNSTDSSVSPKSLIGIPDRFKIEMINRGWICRNVIIWHKPNPMPSSAKDRFTVDFEYLFFFSKNKKYYFEQQFEDMSEITLKDKRVGHDTYKGGSPKEGLYEEAKAQIPYEVRQRIFNNLNPQGRNMRCVWTIPTMPCSEAHFAAFPEKLLMTPIKAGCPEGGIVLDPFAGRGTTGIVARKLGRKYILIDLSYKYCQMAKTNLQQGWLV